MHYQKRGRMGKQLQSRCLKTSVACAISSGVQGQSAVKTRFQFLKYIFLKVMVEQKHISSSILTRKNTCLLSQPIEQLLFIILPSITHNLLYRLMIGRSRLFAKQPRMYRVKPYSSLPNPTSIDGYYRCEMYFPSSLYCFWSAYGTRKPTFRGFMDVSTNNYLRGTHLKLLISDRLTLTLVYLSRKNTQAYILSPFPVYSFAVKHEFPTPSSYSSFNSISVSSLVYLKAACRGVSPLSILPPGRQTSPENGRLFTTLWSRRISVQRKQLILYSRISYLSWLRIEGSLLFLRITATELQR